MVVGTIAYMSPEQACGKILDGRTDIWSLGCVMFEMITGRVPFVGASSSHVIVSILDNDLPPIADFAPYTPAELQRIIATALSKDAATRYASAADLLTDLRQLKHRREVEADVKAETETAHFPLASEHATQMLNSNHLPLSSASLVGAIAPDDKSSASVPRLSITHSAAVELSAVQPAAQAAQLAVDAPGSSVVAAAENIQVARPNFSFRFLLNGVVKRGNLVVIAALLILSSSVALLSYQVLLPPAPAAFSNINISKLTTSGKASDVAISPDGKYVVHIVTDTGGQSLWIRQVATPSNVQIVAASDVEYRGLSFSPDGNYIYYVTRDPANPTGALFQVPVLGGTSRRLLTGIERYVSFSPKADRIAFVRANVPQQGEKSLMIANADGTDARRVETTLAGNLWSPAWSPSGDVIACAAVNTTGGLHVQIVTVRLKDGAVTPVGSTKWFDVGRVAWLTDGSGLLITATTQVSGFANQIWHLPYLTGEARKVTSDLNNYSGIGLTADSSTMVTVKSELRASIWTQAAQSKSGGEAVQITSGNSASDGVYDLAWTRDGKIVYQSNASGDEDIWKMNGDGTNPQQLTAKTGLNLFPVVTPDNRYIVFASTRAGGNTNIWRMDADGGNPVQLTNASIDNFPAVTPDSALIESPLPV